MHSAEDYLDNLELDRQNLVQALRDNDVEVQDNETMTSLVNKVVPLANNIYNEYFVFDEETEKLFDNYTHNDSEYSGIYNVGFKDCFKKIKFDKPLHIMNGQNLFTGLTLDEYPKVDLSDNYMFGGTFSRCNIKEIKDIDFSGILYVAYLFSNCADLIYLDLSSLHKVPNDFTNGNNFYGIPNDCEIIVYNQAVKDAVLTSNSKLTNVKIKDLTSIKFENKNTINKHYTDTMTLNIVYDTSKTEQYGVTYTVEGPATITDGVITLTNDAKINDIITVVATSSYNSNITTKFTIKVIDDIKDIDVDLNNGQFIKSTWTQNNNTVYKSNEGSYGVDNGQSLAQITVTGYSKFVIYIKDMSAYDDAIELFPLNTAAVKGQGIVTTKLNSNVWKKYEYNIPDKTSVNTIDILFSHASYLTGSARGYFYIAEEECE